MDADLDAAIDKVVNGELADVVGCSTGRTRRWLGGRRYDHQTALQAAAKFRCTLSPVTTRRQIANTGRRRPTLANDPLFTAVGRDVPKGQQDQWFMGSEQGWGTANPS